MLSISWVTGTNADDMGADVVVVLSCPSWESPALALARSMTAETATTRVSGKTISIGTSVV